MSTHRFLSRPGAFYLEENEKTVAQITYTPQGSGVISIDHTYVSPGLRGQGIGDDLVRRVVAYAREHDLKIIPSCPYAGHYFDKNMADRPLLHT